jgi:hypothetical protein
MSSEQDHLAMDLVPIDNLDSSSIWLTDTALPAIDFDDFIARSPVLTQPELFVVDDMDCLKSRVRYSISRMKSWPAIFAQKGATCFIHHTLTSYSVIKDQRGGDDGRTGIENVLLDVLSACALYSSRNTDNQRAAFRDIRHKAKALTSMMRSKTVHSPTKGLACLQALSMYQIIRLFDGDIELRAEAEADEALHAHCTDEMTRSIKSLKFPESVTRSTACEEEPLNTNSNEWRRWIFEESVRRATLVSIIIQQNYAFLRGIAAQCTHSDMIGYTARTALWDASSEYHWRLEWTEKPHHEVWPSRWDSVMAHLKPEECDDVSVLLMVLMSGFDSTARWLGKENLVAYGLDGMSMRNYFVTMI